MYYFGEKMSGFSSSHSFSNDSSSENDFFSFSSHQPHKKSSKLKNYLHPITETDDFYDPFSELSLFLSKKIKKEIEKNQKSKQWSMQIESDLLAKILPEFKKRFPRYRLGSHALKKVWEKVSHYYEKLQKHGDIFKKDGSLNLHSMIRESLKNEASFSPSIHLPPYHLAHQVGIKISECIATLEGRSIDLDHLTKMIWVTQKNCLKDLSLLKVKDFHDDYDSLDKIIVKTVLETCATNKFIKFDTLKEAVLQKLKIYGEVKKLIQKNQLIPLLSLLLSRKLPFPSKLFIKLSLLETKSLEAFIDFQLEVIHANPTISLDLQSYEMIQRLLALYPIAKALPKNISENKLKETICLVHALILKKKNRASSSSIDPTLFVFINAQMHLMHEKKSFKDIEYLKKTLIKAYHLCQKLPHLEDELFEIFEILIWKKLEKHTTFLKTFSESTLIFLEKELANHFIDHPRSCFKKIIEKTTHFFQKIEQFPFDEKKNSLFWDTTKKKVEIWSAQNELLCRWIHFDETAPLYLSFKNLLEKTSFKTFPLRSILEKTLEQFPMFKSFKKEVYTRLWILLQYHWYKELSYKNESSYERFIKKQILFLQKEKGNLSQKTLKKELQKTSQEMFPLIPFPEKGIASL